MQKRNKCFYCGFEIYGIPVKEHENSFSKFCSEKCMQEDKLDYHPFWEPAGLCSDKSCHCKQ